MANVNITFKNEKHGKLHATILQDEVWYSIVQNLVQNEDQTEYQTFKEDWSIERRETFVNTSGMLKLLKLGRNEAVSNWFHFFVGEKSDSIAETLEGFEDKCKINVTYEG